MNGTTTVTPPLASGDIVTPRQLAFHASRGGPSGLEPWMPGAASLKLAMAVYLQAVTHAGSTLVFHGARAGGA